MAVKGTDDDNVIVVALERGGQIVGHGKDAAALGEWILVDTVGDGAMLFSHGTPDSLEMIDFFRGEQVIESPGVPRPGFGDGVEA